MSFHHPDAACLHAEPDTFYPEAGGDPRPAKRVCNGDDTRPPCPIKGACLGYALEHHEPGVWGGTTDQQRRAMRRMQGVA